MAHFLEHMLFLGTKKYPNKSHYCRFITEHGGTYNAFTSNDATSYMFAIDNKAFAQAIDRFASFFKNLRSPLPASIVNFRPSIKNMLKTLKTTTSANIG